MSAAEDPQQRYPDATALEPVSIDRGELLDSMRERWWRDAETSADAWCRRCEIHRVPVIGSSTPRFCPVCADDIAQETAARAKEAS